MSVDPNELTTSAFAGLPSAVGSGGGVIAAERQGLGIARLTARRAQGARLAEILRASFRLEPPSAPRRAAQGPVSLARVGPQSWLATREGAGNGFAQSLQSLLGESASVTDQSDAYVILRLSGPKVYDMLAKLVPVDVHPRSFPAGDIAQTLCGYLSVILWRLEDTAEGDPLFEIWGGRSLAVSLHQAIAHSAAEFGFVRQTP